MSAQFLHALLRYSPTGIGAAEANKLVNRLTVFLTRLGNWF